MKYWLDTEFIEDGKTIDLISIGIVAEDGREFYALNFDCDYDKASEWVKENVLSQIPPKPIDGKLATSPHPWLHKDDFKIAIKDFIRDRKPELWGYYADSDWVVFCQLFGTMMDLPQGFPMYCRDIKQWCDDLGNPSLPEQGKGEHNALADAKWNKSAWEFLKEYQQQSKA